MGREPGGTVVKAPPTRRQLIWLWWIWGSSVCLIGGSSLVADLIRVGDMGVLSINVALILLAALLPLLWRVRGGILLAVTAGLSGFVVGGTLACEVVALAFDRPEASTYALQWSPASLVLVGVFVWALRRSLRTGG